MKKLIKPPSPAMVVALVALFVALGGAGYAAIKIPKNSVGTKQLKNAAVTSPKVKDASLRAPDFASGQLPTAGFGECVSTCQTLTTDYARMGTPATVTTAAGGKLSAFAAVSVFQIAPLGGSVSEVACRLEATGPGISGRAVISRQMYTDLSFTGQDATLSLVGGTQARAGTYSVGVYCAGLTPTETTDIYNVNVASLVTG